MTKGKAFRLILFHWKEFPKFAQVNALLLLFTIYYLLFVICYLQIRFRGVMDSTSGSGPAGEGSSPSGSTKKAK
jgi:hypothetical protein